ncbi:LysR family transcriptional regulator [Halioxenophilus sp. WMMB6]|uniref:LysR family transcriptional regulator n=1 Tax=Halioxenophilus sp. WMMB6 TaxID=3073815 RepID=UPI00295F225B|nr:LysR family transcriptional regulator [Halioxenophilus sp. WMMB6]
MALDSFDVKQMKLLLALLEEGNLTRVANKLDVSQQAVSEQLKKLRITFNDKLFVRAKNGVLPTPFAEQLGLVLREVLGQLEHVGTPQAFDPATASNSFTIAASDYAQQVLLVDLVKILKSEAPHLRLTIKSLATNDLERALAQGQFDLCLCDAALAPTGLASVSLLHEQYVCVTSKRNPATRPGTDNSPLLNRPPVIVSEPQDRFARVCEQWFQGINNGHQPPLLVPSVSLAPAYIAANDGVALLPSRLLPDDRLQKLPADNLPDGFELVAVWHDRASHAPLHQWLLAHLQGIAAHKTHQPLSASA